MLKSIKDDSSVLAHVKDLTPAGYDVDILYNGVTMQGFMPNTLAGVNKLHDPESIIGNKFNVII
jgi:ribosomal protein S1